MLSLPHLSHGMKLAAAEARHWLGATYPNPPVGAVALDADGQVLAVAAHQKAGQPHAEAALLELCRREKLLGRVHTLAVTLEPCNHHGRTPPCSEAIIEAGIKHVAIGAADPNPYVKGGGIARLQEAGIQVTTGIEEQICNQLIYAFAYSSQGKQPWLTVKRAFDSKGSMIPPQGQKTFTSHDSLRFAHQLRKRADAILTGSGTILADNPSFTVRHLPDHPGRSRVLAIMDRRRRVPETWLAAAHERGLIPVIYDDLPEAVIDLANRNIREVLVEAGPSLSQSVLASGLWAMDVLIHQGNPDRIVTEFNATASLPFDKQNWQWKYMLPSECKTVCL